MSKSVYLIITRSRGRGHDHDTVRAVHASKASAEEELEREWFKLHCSHGNPRIERWPLKGSLQPTATTRGDGQ